MATFTHIADCGVIGEQELTVSYEVERPGRTVIKSISLGNVPVEVSATYLIHELYRELFEIEASKKDEAGEMRAEMRRAA